MMPVIVMVLVSASAGLHRGLSNYCMDRKQVTDITVMVSCSR